MDLMTVIRERRSIRKFLPEPVDETDIREIVHAGTLAVNAENRQMWYFVAVTDSELVRKMGDAVAARLDGITAASRCIGQGEAFADHNYFMTFFRYAPAVIAVFACPYAGVVEQALANLNMEFKPPLPIVPAQLSIGAAIQNICLVACAKGYGTTCMYAPVLAFREIGDILDVEPSRVLTALIPIGRPAQQPKARPRKPLDEVFKLLKGPL